MERVGGACVCVCVCGTQTLYFCFLSGIRVHSGEGQCVCVFVHLILGLRGWIIVMPRCGGQGTGMGHAEAFFTALPLHPPQCLSPF